MATKWAKSRLGLHARAVRWHRLRGLARRLNPADMQPRRVLVGLLCVLGYTVILSGNLFRPAIPWKLGERAMRDVHADDTVQITDEAATAERRRAAMASLPKDYESREADEQAVTILTDCFDDINKKAEEWRAMVAQALPELRAALIPPELTAKPAPSLDPATRRWLYGSTPEHVDRLRSQALYVIRHLYVGKELHSDMPDDFRIARAEAERLLGLVASPQDRSFLLSLTTNIDILKPNRVYREYETWRKRLNAAEAVEPERRTIRRGDLVVRRDTVITAEHQAAFEALGLLRPQWNYPGLFALGSLVCAVLIILGSYVRAELPEVYRDTRKIVLINAIAAGALLVFRLFMWLKGEIPSLAHGAILCGSTTGMIMAVLVDYRLAMMMTGALALFLGVIVPGAGLWVAFEGWLAGRVGAMAMRRVVDRVALARAGVVTAVAGTVIAVVVSLPASLDAAEFRPGQIGSDALFGFGWSLLGFLLAQGLSPMLERTFACLTPFRLLDLTNTATPVLQALKRQARGSFDASLTIGDMAADACEVIPGADPLLARACGYHHDIGKVGHPSWFIENQFGAENVHDRIPPLMSARAIRSHVEHGKLLADEFGLPEPVKAVITEHHGTTLISFFYFRALEAANEGQTVDESAFRYRGPLPSFKESGVIMLADGIEAAVRAASRHGALTERRIQEIVDQVIKKRLDEGQLDHCDLTLRDLDRARTAFCEFLRGMYHSRIDYPAQSLERKRNGRSDGGADGGRD